MANIEGKSLILYHKDDNDGVFSCALLYNYLVYELQCEKEDVICVGLDYDIASSIKRKDIKEWSKVYTHLFITDFSLPIPIMRYAYKLFENHFVWLDHHKPIIEAANNTELIDCQGSREINRSAILNVWKWLYDQFNVDWFDDHEKIPKLLRILSGWDSFTYEQEGFDLDYVRKVNYGITHLFNLNLTEVSKELYWLYTAKTNEEDGLEEKLINRAYQVGKILVDDENNRMTDIIKRSGDKEWTVGPDNRTAVAVFIQGPSNSRMFESVIGECQNAIVFKRNAKGTWAISLYNPDETDTTFHCGAYCRENYKGGGHVGAAGFQVKQSKFIQMLRTKHI